MKILNQPIKKAELPALDDIFGDKMTKAVVDVKRKLLAIDAPLHYELEDLLLKDGSQQENLWGINLFPDNSDESFVIFDSLINIRPNQGNPSRDVVDENIQRQIKTVVQKWVK